MFVSLRIGDQAIAAVRAVKGALGIVRCGEQYAVVPNKVIAYLRERENPNTGLHHWEETQLVANKTRVRILEGPFAGLEGIYVRESGLDRVLVLLNILGNETSVRIPEAALEPLRP